MHDDWKRTLAMRLRSIRDRTPSVRAFVDPLLLALTRPPAPANDPDGERVTSQLARDPIPYGGTPRRSRPRKAKLHGVAVHTTGSSLPRKAGWDADAALRRAAKYYTRDAQWAGPHYVIGWGGEIVSTLVDEDMAGAHAGITDAQALKTYASGGWEARMSVRGAKLWHARWDRYGFTSPRDLIPNRNLYSINDWWLGIEMIPITDGKTVAADPAYPGARFTREQHSALRGLCWDIAARNYFPNGWASAESTRLLGHSDLNPIQRDSKGLPMWDPGYHDGLVDLDYVRFGGTPKRHRLDVSGVALPDGRAPKAPAASSSTSSSSALAIVAALILAGSL